MPAIITHYLFGQEATRKLSEDIVDDKEELLAFLLGNQGPDPLWAHFRASRSVSSSCSELASAMHAGKVTEAFMVLRSTVTRLPEADKSIGMAFALGLLSHYVLDSHVHPFVFAQEQAICAADPELQPRRKEVHAVIESDLDSWMLWHKRRATVLDAPAGSCLDSTDAVLRVGGALLAQVGWEVFAIKVGADAYAGCVRDYRTIYSIVDPAPAKANKLLKLLDPFTSQAAYLRALGHYVRQSDECPAANLARLPWSNPFTDETRTASFDDLFSEALDSWPDYAQAFVRRDDKLLQKLTQEYNYDGALISER